MIFSLDSNDAERMLREFRKKEKEARLSLSEIDENRMEGRTELTFKDSKRGSLFAAVLVSHQIPYELIGDQLPTFYVN